MKMENEGHRRKRARQILSKAGYHKSGGHFKKGGHVHADEKEDEEMLKEKIKPSALKKKLKDGGRAEGGKPKHRADMKPRGKPHVQVNVINAGHKPSPPMPIPIPGGGPGGPPPPPGAGAMPPPGMGPGGPPPGPMGLKKGGRARKPKIDSQRNDKPGMPRGHFKKGGKTSYPISDGAGGAKGRLEKAKAYGA